MIEERMKNAMQENLPEAPAGFDARVDQLALDLAAGQAKGTRPVRGLRTGLILAMVMAVSAVYGDLFESQWKRFYGVKDSGNIIPGHGGLLDRFDSILFTSCTVFYYYTILVLK